MSNASRIPRGRFKAAPLAIVVLLISHCLAAFAATPTITSVTAQQRYPWNGLVDIVVTMSGETSEVAQATCTFAATNSTTQTALAIEHITQVGTDSGSGNIWTRRFLWDTNADVGEVKIADVALVVELNPLGGVQLWEGGPYWAECNVGASQPEEYGYYFWWGDTVGYKEASNWNDCPTDNKTASELLSLGYIDSTGNLAATYDAARKHLGAPWRMPTSAEFAALISNCDAQWINRNGVNGRLVMGRGAYSERHIFLPAGGDGFNKPGAWSSYRTSTPKPNSPYDAYCLSFDSSTFCLIDDQGRWLGTTIRPVRGLTQMDSGVATTHLSLDNRTGIRIVNTTELIRLSPKWETDEVGAIAKVSTNGVVAKSSPVADAYEWVSSQAGTYLLAHVVSTNDVQVGETLSATFIVENPLLPDGGPYTNIVDGIAWTFMVVNGEASLGGGPWEPAAISATTMGDLTIPATLGGCPVTSIGNHAFFNCTELAAVEMPSSVTNIGSFAFQCCIGLKEVAIPESVTSIGAYAFDCCSGLENVVIPKGVTSIEYCTFNDCSGLTNVTLSSCVTNISPCAFSGCIGIVGMTISESVTSIGGWAFAGCSGLDTVTIPSSVTSIGKYAFGGCSGLTGVDFEGAPPAGVEYAELNQDVFVRYNVNYEDEWLPVIEACGWTNVTAYVPEETNFGIETETLHDATEMEAYEASLVAAGGMKPYQWEILADWPSDHHLIVSCTNTFSEVGEAQSLFADGGVNELTYALLFSFPLCGRQFESVTVNANGYLAFDTGDDGYAYIGDVSLMLQSVSDDHDVYVAADSRFVTIRWKGFVYGTSDELNFSITLYPSGGIRFSYGDCSDVTMDASVQVNATSCLNEGFHVDAGGFENIVFIPSYLPQGLSLDWETGVISGVPTQAGDYPFHVRVTDDEGNEDVRKLVLHVAENKNMRPIVDSATSEDDGNSPLHPGEKRIYRIAAHDPEGSTLTFKWYLDDGEVPALSAGSADSSYDMIANYEMEGEHTLTCTVSDDLWQEVVSQSWQFYVGQVHEVTAEMGADAIQEALDVAEEGDLIRVGPGTYSPVDCYPWNVWIEATDGPAVTFIDGGGISQCVCASVDGWYDRRWASIVGFTLCNGVAYGGGAACYSRLVGCVITNNSATIGGGLYYCVAENCLIVANAAVSGGGACYSTLGNCTVVENSADDEAGGIYSGFAYNSIIWNNVAADGEVSDALYSSLYNCCASPDSSYFEQAPVTEDPLFADPDSGDYSLSADSPCIGMGKNDYVRTDVDLSGNERIRCGSVDIGCYESPYALTAPTEAPTLVVSPRTYCVGLYWDSVKYAKWYRAYRAPADDQDDWELLGQTEYTRFGDYGAESSFRYVYRVVPGNDEAGEGSESERVEGALLDPLIIVTDSLPTVRSGLSVELQLEAEGGAGNYAWSVPPYDVGSTTNSFVETGTAMGWQADEEEWDYALPFKFPVGNETITNLTVSANGYVVSNDGPDVGLYAFVGDLTTEEGDIYIDEQEDHVTIRWEGAIYDVVSDINVSMTLYADGRVRIARGVCTAESDFDGRRGFFTFGEMYLGQAESEDDLILLPNRLPDGLELDSDGVLRGAPTEPGEHSFVVRTTDGNGESAEKTLALTVGETFLADGGPYTNVVDGVAWVFSVRNGEAEIGVRNERGFVQWQTAVSPLPTGTLKLPATLGGCPVTGIGYAAFLRCWQLTEVVLPATITSIGSYAFSWSGLQSVVLPDSVRSIGNYAFANDQSLVEIELGAGVTNIDNGFLAWTPNLERISVDEDNPSFVSENGGLFTKDKRKLLAYATLSEEMILPKEIEVFGEDVLCNQMSNLSSISVEAGNTNFVVSNTVLIDMRSNEVVCGPRTIEGTLVLPDGVVSIGEYAFYAAEYEEVVFPTTLKRIKSSAFEGCGMLRSAELPEGLETIDDWVFCNCDSLFEVGIPSTVVKVGCEAYVYTAWWNERTYDSDLDEDRYPGWLILDGWVVGGVFEEELHDISFADGVKGLAYGVPSCCFNELYSVQLPSSLRYIGDEAFSSSYCADRLELPEGIVSIGVNAFGGNPDLREVTLPSTLLSIGDYAFGWCDSLQTIHAMGDAPSVGEEPFYCSTPQLWVLPGSVGWFFDESASESGRWPTNCEYSAWVSYWQSPRPQIVEMMNPDGKGRYVEIVNMGSDAVYYTTDGSDPRVSGILYEGLIPIDGDVTIRAVGKTEGMPDSEVAVRAFGSDDVPNWFDSVTTTPTRSWEKDDSAILPAGCSDGFSARTVSPGANGYSSMSMRVRGRWAMSFKWRSSTEEDCDFGTFMVNGMTVAQISGEQGWTRVLCYLEEPCNELSWCYNKDFSVNAGEDCIWVADVRFWKQPVSGIGATIFCWDYDEDKGAGWSFPPGNLREWSAQANFGDQYSFWMFVEGPVDLSFDWTLPSTVGEDSLALFIDNVEVDRANVCDEPENYVHVLAKTGIHSVEWRYQNEGDECSGARVTDVTLSECSQQAWNYVRFMGMISLMPMSDGRSCVIPEPEGELVVPETIDGFPVATISEGAFADCQRLTSVKIPASVTSVDPSAFVGCSSLTNISVYGESEDPVYVAIDGILYERQGDDYLWQTGETGTHLYMAIWPEGLYVDTFVCPEGVVDLDWNANLRQVSRLALSSTFVGFMYGADGVAGLGSWPNLTSIDVTEGNPYYYSDNGALYSYKRVYYETRDVPVRLVFWPRNKQPVTLLDTLQDLESCAFANSDEIEEIVLSTNMVTIVSSAFKGCSSLKRIVVPEGNRIWKSVDGVLYSKDMCICPPGYEGELVIPEDETARYFVFDHVAGLTMVQFPASYTNATSGYIFNCCTNLQTIAFAGLPPSGIKWEIFIYGSGVDRSKITIVYPDEFATEWSEVADTLAQLGYEVMPESEFDPGSHEREDIDSSVNEDGTLKLTQYTGEPVTHLEIPEFIGLRMVTVIGREFSNGTQSLYPGEAAYVIAPMSIVTVPATVKCIEERAFGYCDGRKYGEEKHINSESFAVNGIRFLGDVPFFGDGYGTEWQREWDGDAEQIWNDTRSAPFSLLTKIYVKREYAENWSAFLAKFGMTIAGYIGEDSDCNGVICHTVVGDWAWTYMITNGTAVLSRWTARTGTKSYPEQDDGGAIFVAGGRLCYPCVTSVSGKRIEGEVRIPDEFDMSDRSGSWNLRYKVVGVGDSAFSRLSIDHVWMGGNIVRIGKAAFAGCKQLFVVEHPQNVREIGDYAFSGCSTLGAISHLNSLERLGKGAFASCTSLFTAEIFGTLAEVPDLAFANCTSLENIEMPNLVSIGPSAFAGCTALKGVRLSDTLTSVGDNAFAQCLGLESLEIPEGVTNVGSRAFTQCEKLAQVSVLGASVAVGDFAFAECPALANVSFADNASSLVISDAAFSDCGSLKMVRFPKGLSSLGDCAFADCLALADVYYEGRCPKTEGERGVYDGANPYLISFVHELKGSGFPTTDWQNRPIASWTDYPNAVAHRVIVFDLGGRAERQDGGELVQRVTDKSQIVEPTLTTADGAMFAGWEADYREIRSALRLNARYVDDQGLELADYYVRSDGSDANDGLSRATAFRTIGKAIDAAEDGSLILVGDGVYPPIVCADERVLVIRSENGAAKTVISGEGTSRCALFSSDRVQVSGFTFRDGRSFEQDDGTGGAGSGVFGGTYVDCVISNCVVLSDAESSCAAAVAAKLFNCLIVNNRVEGEVAVLAGGALDCELTGCTVAGNTTPQIACCTTNACAIGGESYETPVLTLTPLSDSVAENATAGMRVRLSRTGLTGCPAVVSLRASSSQVSVPSQVEIPVGSSSTIFTVVPVDNASVNGDRSVRIEASSLGSEACACEVLITDDEIPSLTMSVSADTISEGGDKITVTITRDLITDKPLTVYLTGLTASRCSCPSSVEIPAGRGSVTFEISAVDDDVARVAAEMTLRASTAGYASVAKKFTVEDDDVPGVTLTIAPEEAQEGGSVRAILERVDKNDTSKAITVKLTASDPDEIASMPSSVVIPAGIVSRDFNIYLADDEEDNGDRLISLTGAILIESCGCSGQPSSGDAIAAELWIVDNDGPSLSLTVTPTVLKEGTSGMLTVSRNSSYDKALVVGLSTDRPEEIDLPASVTIPANTRAISVSVRALDDGVEDGNQFVSIYADDPEGSFAPDSKSLIVTDQNLPDLVVQGFADVDDVEAGALVRASVTVANVGFADCTRAVPYSAFVVPADTQDVESGALVMNGTLPGGLAAGVSEEASFTFNAPDSIGRWRIAVVLDQDGGIPELDDANNSAWSGMFYVGASYSASVQTDGVEFMRGEAISFAGIATMSDGTTPAANVEVEIYVICDGIRHTLTAMTAADGTFATDFMPSSGLCGHCQAGACYPGSGREEAQTSFDILGLKRTTSDVLVWDIALGDSLQRKLSVRNPTGLELNDLRLDCENLPKGCELTLSGPTTLAANEPSELLLTATGTDLTDGEDYESFDITLTTHEGASLTFRAYFHCQNQQAQLRTTPAAVDVTMTLGKTRYVDVEIRNDGKGDSGTVETRITCPDWLHVLGGDIKNLAFGESATVSLELSPTREHGLLLNKVYPGSIVFVCENGKSVTLPVRFTPVTEEYGAVRIDATDDYTKHLDGHPHLANATVEIKNYYTQKVVASGKTGPDGIWTAEGLPEGSYQLTVTADKHGSYEDEIIVDPGRTNGVTAFLPYQSVRMSWDVEKVEISDEYEPELTLVYETNVPQPTVLAHFDPNELPALEEGGQSTFVIRLENVGLIAAKRVRVDMPTIEGHTLTLADNDVYVGAGCMVEIPVVFSRQGARKQKLAAAAASVVEKYVPCTYYPTTTTYYDCNGEQHYSTQWKLLHRGGNCKQVTYIPEPTTPTEYVPTRGGSSGGYGGGTGGIGDGGTASVQKKTNCDPKKSALRTAIENCKAAWQDVVDYANVVLDAQNIGESDCIGSVFPLTAEMRSPGASDRRLGDLMRDVYDDSTNPNDDNYDQNLVDYPIDLTASGYHRLNQIETKSLVGEGFFVWESGEISKTDGFKARLYASDTDPNDLVLSFAGSEAQLADWRANMQNAVCKSTEQYSYAAELLRQVLANWPGKITVVGHSLGGGLTQYVMLMNNLDGRVSGVTYNSAGICRSQVPNLNSCQVAAANIVNYRAKTDYVSAYGDFVGTIYNVPSAYGHSSVYFGTHHPTTALSTAKDIGASLLTGIAAGLHFFVRMPVENTAKYGRLAKYSVASLVELNMCETEIKTVLGLDAEIPWAEMIAAAEYGELGKSIGQFTSDAIKNAVMNILLAKCGLTLDFKRKAEYFGGAYWKEFIDSTIGVKIAQGAFVVQNMTKANSGIERSPLDEWLELPDADINAFLIAAGALPGDWTNEQLREIAPASVSDDAISAFNARMHATARELSGEVVDEDTIDFYEIDRATKALRGIRDYALSQGYNNVQEMWEDAFRTIADYLQDSEGACASVTLGFKQTVALTREAFDGTLTIENGHATTGITDLTFEPEIYDADGFDRTDCFLILTNEVAVAADGMVLGTDVPAMGKGTTVVRFIPLPGKAAHDGAQVYRFGGTVRYTDPFTGKPYTVELQKVSLTVEPSPYLKLDYFVQRDIFSDDPETPEIEPSIPAEIALLVQNVGEGAANNVTISSMQPELKENEKGLAVAFKLSDYFSLDDSAVDGKTANLGLLAKVSLGSVDAHTSKVAQWWLTSSIQGHFTDMTATCVPVNKWNTPESALVDYEHVYVHKLVRSVQADDDGLPDFLTCDDSNLYGVPDELYTSGGDQLPVRRDGSASASGDLTGATADLSVHVTASEGWNYVYVALPGVSGYAVESLSCGAETLPARNAWTTDRTFKDADKPIVEDRLHLLVYFDKSGTGDYVLRLKGLSTNGPKVVAFEDIAPGGVEYAVRNAVGVVFDKPIDPATFTADDLQLIRQGEYLDVREIAALSIVATDATETRFTISGLSECCAEKGRYELIVQCAKIADANGLCGATGKSVSWMFGTAGSPVLLDAQRKAGIAGNVFTFAFSAPIENPSFALYRDGILVEMPETLSVKDKGIGVYEITGIDAAVSAQGDYRLVCTGYDSPSIEWSHDTTPPAPARYVLVAGEESWLMDEEPVSGWTSVRNLMIGCDVAEDCVAADVLCRQVDGSEVLLASCVPTELHQFMVEVVLPTTGWMDLVVRSYDENGLYSDAIRHEYLDILPLTAELSGVPEDKSEVADAVTLAFSDAVIADDVALDRFTLSFGGETVALDGVTLSPSADGKRFVLAGLSAFCAEDGVYTLAFDSTNVRKRSSGLKASVCETLAWTYECPDREPPTVVSVVIDGAEARSVYTNGISSVAVTFSEEVNLSALVENGLIGQALTIQRLDANGVVTGVVRAVASEVTCSATEIAWSLPDGAVGRGPARLVVDSGLVADLAGNKLAPSGFTTIAGLQSFLFASNPLATVASYAMPTWYDYDGDGLGDLIVGEKTAGGQGKVRVYRNVGTATAPAFAGYTHLQAGGVDLQVSAAGCQGVQVCFADFNGDDSKELVIGEADGTVLTLAFPSSLEVSSGALRIRIPDYPDFGSPRACVCPYDLDGDGCDELVVGGLDGKFRRLKLHAQNYVSQEWLADADGTPLTVTAGRSSPVLADINNDGCVDILSGDTDGNVWAFLGEGATWNATPVALFKKTSTSSDRSRLGFGDVNGDGVGDLLVGRSDGTVTCMSGVSVDSPAFGFTCLVPMTGVSAADVSKTYDGQGVSIDVGVSDPPDGYTIQYRVGSEGDYTAENPVFKNAGAAVVEYAVSAPNYLTYTNSAKVTILRREVTLTSGSAEKPYDETPLTCATVEVSGDGFAAGEGATYAVAGSQTNVGTSENVFTYTFTAGTLAANYEISVVTGTLTVLPNKKTVKIPESHSETVPPSGDVEVDYGDVLTVSLAQPVVCVGSTQYVCVGWAANNANPSAGEGSTATFKVLGDVELSWLWRTNVLSLAEALNAPDREIEVGGAAEWTPAWSDEAPDGEHCVRIGGIANKTNAWLQTTVEGPGEISFSWKCSLASRNTKVQFFVDDVSQGAISEQVDWTTVRVTVFGDGEHVVKWRLFTGRSGASADDMAVIDGLVWTPTVPPTLAEALNTNLVWRTDGAVIWRGVAKESLLDVRDAWASASGLDNLDTSAVWTKVYGSGVLSFDWAISCEEDYDWMELSVDGNVCTYITGEVDWETAAVEIRGEGWHVVRWEFVKDEEDEEELVGGNTAWLDSVVWTSSDVAEEPDVPEEPVLDPIPDLGDAPSALQVQKALDGSGDGRLAANVTNGVIYNAYRNWANKVELQTGGKAGPQAVKDSPNAWLSFAVDSPTLVETLPTDGDVKIETFEPKASNGTYDFTVSVDGLTIGSEAVAENLKTIFELEGGATLDPKDMSGENVSITFGTPVDGKLRFTAGPKDTTQKSFFMKMKMNPK